MGQQKEDGCAHVCLARDTTLGNIDPDATRKLGNWLPATKNEPADMTCTQKSAEPVAINSRDENLNAEPEEPLKWSDAVRLPEVTF